MLGRDEGAVLGSVGDNSLGTSLGKAEGALLGAADGSEDVGAPSFGRGVGIAGGFVGGNSEDLTWRSRGYSAGCS